MILTTDCEITVVGLGYVGLPIFIRLQGKFKTIGFDIDQNRIFSLNKGIIVIFKNQEYKIKLVNHPPG